MPIEYLEFAMTEEQVTRTMEMRAIAAARERHVRPLCAHDGYSFIEHGQRCPHCGEFLIDFGD